MPRKSTVEVDDTENRLLRKTRLPLMRLPLSTAVLVGEKVCKENLAPEDIQNYLFTEWIRCC